MKAHLFATSLLGLTAHAAVHHDIAGLAARQAFPSGAAVSVCYTYTSTYLTVGPGPTPLPPAYVPIILAIEPLNVAKRDLQKRAGLGGFVTDDPANPNALNCSGATVFQLQIGGGVILDKGIPLFTTPGASFQQFLATGPGPAGAITATFSGQEGSILTWANASFFGGAATFCQVPATGQVYSTFGGPTNVPAGCVTIQLRVYSVADCNNGVINPVSSSSSASSTTSDVTLTSSTVPETVSSTTITDNGSSTTSTTSDVTLTSSTVPETVSSTSGVTLTSSTVTETVSSTTITDNGSSTTSTTSDVTLTSSTVPETVSSTSGVTLTSSTVTETVSSTTITDNGSSTTSSASQITITSTSTETTFVVVSSTSAGAAASSAACSFSTSGSLILNGGFENPSSDPFAFAPLGVLPVDVSLGVVPPITGANADEVSALAIVSSAAVPVAFTGLCNYVLEVSYGGGQTVQSTDVYGTLLPYTLLLQTYSISFNVLACGAVGSGSVFVSINGFQSETIQNQDCTAAGVTVQTITGTFTATGVLDIVNIHATGGVTPSQIYLDNFIIVAA